MMRYIFIFLLWLSVTACDQPKATEAESSNQDHQTKPAAKIEATQTKPFTFMNETTALHSFETTAEALSVWRQYTDQQPALLLLSNNPHLSRTPEALQGEISALINNATADEIALAATDHSPDPLMLPGMAVDAALRNGWLSEFVWALPLRDHEQELSLEKFAEQMKSSGLADESELESLSLSDRHFHGRLRERPFTAAALPLLQELPQPMIIHIDLSYFQPIYKNEISTPLFDVIHKTLGTLKKMQPQTLAVTFSYAHTDSQISLDVRFLGDIISWLIEDPTRLDQPIPLNWQRQRDTLYLANFFKKAEIREIFQKQEQDAPEEAWIKFNLYRSAAEHKEGSKALEYLAQAVDIDPTYAFEYHELSKLAYERGRPDQSMRMLSLAAEVFPHDPFTKLEMAKLAYELRDKETAMHLLTKLRDLQWSELYYPQMQQYLADVTEQVQEMTETQSNPTKQPNPETDQARQRLMHPNK